ncbi:hypothetical protein LXL04_028242 [Taraxacum kok-saghyz]
MFGKRKRKPMLVADDIYLNSYTWVKYRGRLKNLKWKDWGSMAASALASSVHRCGRLLKVDQVRRIKFGEKVRTNLNRSSILSCKGKLVRLKQQLAN